MDEEEERENIETNGRMIEQACMIMILENILIVIMMVVLRAICWSLERGFDCGRVKKELH